MITTESVPKPGPEYITGYAQGYANATKNLQARIKELEDWNKKRIKHIELLEEEGINLMIEVKELKQTKEK